MVSRNVQEEAQGRNLYSHHKYLLRSPKPDFKIEFLPNSSFPTFTKRTSRQIKYISRLWQVLGRGQKSLLAENHWSGGHSERPSWQWYLGPASTEVKCESLSLLFRWQWTLKPRYLSFSILASPWERDATGLRTRPSCNEPGLVYNKHFRTGTTEGVCYLPRSYVGRWKTFSLEARTRFQISWHLSLENTFRVHMKSCDSASYSTSTGGPKWHYQLGHSLYSPDQRFSARTDFVPSPGILAKVWRHIWLYSWGRKVPREHFMQR